MKQFITLLAIIFTIATTATARPISDDKNPSVRSKRFNDEKHELKLSPNPKTGNVLVSFTAEKNGKGMIVVLDEAGNTVLKQPVTIAEGKNKINVNNFINLEEGYYTVCVNTNHSTYSAPFLLWK